MPVVGNEDTVVVTIGHPATGNVPDCLQGCLREQCVTEHEIHATASVDVVALVERRVVNEDKVDPVNVRVVVADLVARGQKKKTS